MYLKWTQHLDDQEQKERFKNEVLGSRKVLQRLADILKEDMQSLESKEISVKAFEDPNWAYRQAYYNGGKATYAALLKLIDLDKQIIIPDLRSTND